MRNLESRFIGSLLGSAIGDAVGGLFEAQLPEHIRARFESTRELLDHCREELWYTDDTQMTIGVAEELIASGEVEESSLCKAFVSNYDPTRGYGRGARIVLEAMEAGQDYQKVAEKHFPGGSFGNGAAMRVAPVGLYFCDQFDKIAEQARLSALPTHRHFLGIEGAQLIAFAVAIAATSEKFEKEVFLSRLEGYAVTEAYRDRVRAIGVVQKPQDLQKFGNGIEAINSVVTAIACFCLTPDSFEESIGNAIFLGGDTDTIAAMAGAISGAYLGEEKLPTQLVGLLEPTPKGGAYIRKLGMELFSAFEKLQ